MERGEKRWEREETGWEGGRRGGGEEGGRGFGRKGELGGYSILTTHKPSCMY